MNGLLSVSEAQQRLIEAFSPVKVSKARLSRSAGRVLAKTIISPRDLPAFSNSTMDGFAARAQNLKGASRESPVVLRVVGDIAAGQSPQVELQTGQAARIMTGAPLPVGADCVAPVEETDHPARGPGEPLPRQVLIFRSMRAGENIRPQGQDVWAGQVVVEAGVFLRPQEVGFLAMIGLPEVPVYCRPRVALLSTGDELVPVGTPLQPGKIHDSNAYFLSALIKKCGGVSRYLGIASDRADDVETLLDRAIESKADLLLTSAGVSVGAFDWVRYVVEKNGRLDFWRVNMRPGKPLAFGSYRGTPFIGLPGNPVSAFVGFEVFVRPALLKLAGARDWGRPYETVVLADAVESDGRESYLRSVVVKQDGRRVARLTGHQGSGNLVSLVQANALLIVPSGVKSLPAGAEVQAWIFDDHPPGL